MTPILQLAYALSVLGMFACLAWGFGSAMMNGLRYSSFGPSAAAAGVCFIIAFGCAQILGIK